MKFRDRLDKPAGRMVVSVLAILLLFIFAFMLRAADYETFGLMCESCVFVWIFMVVPDIVDFFFSSYRDYKKEKANERKKT